MVTHPVFAISCFECLQCFTGLGISFVAGEEDAKALADVQSRFEVNISELPDQIDTTTYSK